MFSGIIETIATLNHIKKEGTNLTFTFESEFTHELKVDQSVAHSGVCLTVVAIDGNEYKVTAIDETLRLTNLGKLKVGDKVNFERCIKMHDRLDGHIVQGHVDQVGSCTEVKEEGGSWVFSFEYDLSQKNITIEKGSITVNGTSLTVVNSGINTFSVAIIPYTYEHTNFHTFEKGTLVNLEFDVVGKYITKMQQLR